MLARPTHPSDGIHARLAGWWGALGQRAPPTHRAGFKSTWTQRPPTNRAGNTPQRGVARPPGGQRPISLEDQIYLPAIDTLVTGMGSITSSLHYIVITSQSFQYPSPILYCISYYLPELVTVYIYNFQAITLISSQEIRLHLCLERRKLHKFKSGTIQPTKNSSR